MAAVPQYPLLKSHDPDGTRLRTIKVLVDVGDALLPATTLVPVDATGAQLVGSDFTVELVAMGLILETASGDIWGVNFRIHGGVGMVDANPVPTIRLRPWLASQPDAPAYDQTFRVPVKQT